jgi:AraC-like DNA-binding protein
MLKPIRIRHYLNLMQTHGLTANEVLADSGIDHSMLANSSYLIQPEQCHVVVSNIIRLSGEPCIGLKIGAETSLANLGIIGYAMASSTSLRQMIEIWTKYGQSPVGFPFSFPVEIEDRRYDSFWDVSTPPIGVSGEILRFYVEECLAMGIKNFGPVLTGMPFDLERIELPYHPKSLAISSLYESFFSCPVNFGCSETRVVVRSPALDVRVADVDDDFRDMCIRQCGLLVQQFGRHGPVGTKLWSMLRTKGAILNLEQAASSLGMSSRTLRRYLKNENSTYQEVLDDFRCDLAKAYMTSGMMPAKEVGYLLGFSKVDAFRRAFKVWTGKTVGEYKASVEHSIEVN